MMGPEHYREAEKLLRAAAETADAGHSAWCQQQAHVHATLALAAATEPVRPAASEDTIEQSERDMPGWVRALNLTPEPWGHWCCQAGALAHPSPCPWHPIASEDTKDQLWSAAWDAYHRAYNEFRDQNPGWRAFYTAHHGSALDAALRAYDVARGTLVEDDSATEPDLAASEDTIQQVARTMHRADRYRIADDWHAMDDNGRSVYLDCARALAAAGLLPTPTHDVLYATRDEAYRELFTLRARIEKAAADHGITADDATVERVAEAISAQWLRDEAERGGPNAETLARAAIAAVAGESGDTSCDKT